MLNAVARNANNVLNAYALNCGYVDRVENGRFAVELYYEHGVAHVRSFAYLDDEQTSLYLGDWNKRVTTGGSYRTWFSFDTLTPAVRLYVKLRNAIENEKWNRVDALLLELAEKEVSPVDLALCCQYC